MIKLLMIGFFAGFILTSCAQKHKKEEIPSAAKTAFAAKFPKAQKVKWHVEKPGEFEAVFTLNGVESAALYDTNCQLIETETEINESALPQAVLAAMAKDFAGYKIIQIEQVINHKNVVTYNMIFRKGKMKYGLVFNTNGKLIKKENIMKESDDVEFFDSST